MGVAALEPPLQAAPVLSKVAVSLVLTAEVTPTPGACTSTQGPLQQEANMFGE